MKSGGCTDNAEKTTHRICYDEYHEICWKYVIKIWESPMNQVVGTGGGYEYNILLTRLLGKHVSYYCRIE